MEGRLFGLGAVVLAAGVTAGCVNLGLMREGSDVSGEVLRERNSLTQCIV